MITEEKIREIRLRDAKDLEIDGFDEKFKIVKMSAAALFELAQMDQADTPAAQLARFRFQLAHALSHSNGELLSASEADLLLSVLSLDSLKKMLDSAKPEKTEAPAGKPKGSKR